MLYFLNFFNKDHDRFIVIIKTDSFYCWIVVSNLKELSTWSYQQTFRNLLGLKWSGQRGTLSPVCMFVKNSMTVNLHIFQTMCVSVNHLSKNKSLQWTYIIMIFGLMVNGKSWPCILGIYMCVFCTEQVTLGKWRPQQYLQHWEQIPYQEKQCLICVGTVINEVSLRLKPCGNNNNYC